MKVGDTILLLFLIGALVFGIYVLWSLLPGESVAYEPVKGSYQKNSILAEESSVQFYSRMRFSSNRISYHIENACGSEKLREVVNAFSLLSADTVLQFYPNKDDGMIEVLCSEVAPTPEQREHFVAGEGGPTSIINASSHYVIMKGKISLFRSESCDYPLVAMHEILHALGFDHNADPKSIMYPITNCEQVLDKHIIDEINELYKDPTLPDLVILNVKASKSGRYLAFDATIANFGLVDADSAYLRISSKDLMIREFKFEEGIPLGARKTLYVKDLRIPADTETLSFESFLADGSNEISLENNKVTLKILEEP